ncbi:MAG: methionyl-tRNA formyltransferase [Candidatus Omnitrophica bacterium]|nr:methionyl-tRNA formyltransferase [Candidatus Omnitrophota bacterium]MDD5310392.1 methionyl-tRNA formyltransferase [Candidatus Omnitrophota bacterium]MDD5545937.1 methionyl-tRNA formyltransferase [Candidatus Omnitrophota bacterium]
MTIVFFGTSGFAVPSLVKLSKFHDIAAVVTKPDRPKGRNLKPAPSLVKIKADSLDIPVTSIDDISSARALDELKKYKADLFVVIAYGKILPGEILSLPKIYSIGLHASLLPKYRGASPINWAILNGEEKTGVTVFKLSGKMDAGEIITQKDADILDSDNAETLSEKLSNLGANLLVRAVDSIEERKAQFIKQDESEASLTPKLKKEDGRIVWDKPASEVHNKVRAFYGWPGAFSSLNGRIIKIWATEPSDLPAQKGQSPGRIAALDSGGITVACGSGFLRIKELQPEGGKRMKAKDYVLGNKVSVGDSFVN